MFSRTIKYDHTLMWLCTEKRFHEIYFRKHPKLLGFADSVFILSWLKTRPQIDSKISDSFHFQFVDCNSVPLYNANDSLDLMERRTKRHYSCNGFQNKIDKFRFTVITI